MSRHIIGTFIEMAIIGFIFWNCVIEVAFKVLANGWVRIFIYRQ